MTQTRGFSSNVTSPGFRRRVVARQVKGQRAQRDFGTVHTRAADRRLSDRRRAISDARKRRDIASGRRGTSTTSSRTTDSIRSFHRRSATQGVEAARRFIRKQRRSRTTGRFIK